MAQRLLAIVTGLTLVINCHTLGRSVNIASRIVDCECVRTQRVFNILQTLVTGSRLSHLTIITDATQQGCGDLTDLQDVLFTFSCSGWDFNLFLTAPVYKRTTLSTIIINCDTNTTENIVQEILAMRREGIAERRLLFPFYNFIMTQPVTDDATFWLDLSGVHQINIVRTLRETVDEAGCSKAEYKIQTREGDGAWRVVGRYRDTYHGDPGFIRNKFVNFEGMSLKVTHVLYSPFTMMRNGVYYGFCIDILEYLARQLNFTYELIYSTDYQFGIKKSNGHWNGMIGMMEREEVDMVMAGMTITGQRETVVDFSIPFFEETSAIVVRADLTRKEIPWSYLFDPLQFHVWLAVASSLVICAAIISVFDQLATFIRQYDKGGTMSHKDTTAPSLIDRTWLMVCIYARQGAERLPLAGSVRLSLGIIWILPLLAGWLYSANLMASLATIETKPPFNTLDELANDTEYTLLMNGGSVQRLVLENSKSGVYAALWAKVLKTKDESLLAGTATALRVMFNDSQGQKKYAIAADRTSIETKLSRDYGSRCDWALIPETFFTSGLGIALPEGSPYKEVFDRGVMRAMSSGLILKYQMKNFYKSSCIDIKQGTHTESKNISLGHVRTVFILLLVGIAASAGLLLMENIFRDRPRVGNTRYV